MEINLSKVISYSKDCLQSRAQMRSIMMDLYPGKTRDMNVLLAVYESGVPRKIKNEGEINDELYASYVKKIADDYGLKENYIEEALDAWIDVCIRPGASKKINKQKNNVNQGNRESYNRPIVHNQNDNNVKRVVGNNGDYELQCVGTNRYEIKKFIGFDQAETIIPTEISGKKIVGIGEYAFKKCQGINSLIIPEGIEYLSVGSFCECNNLQKVVFPNSLKQISKETGSKKYRSVLEKHGTFENTALTEIDLPNDIVEIGEDTFKGCKKLKKVIFPDNLKVIGSKSFSGCELLIEICFPPKVEVVEYLAFSRCTILRKVVLNNGLKKIDSYAFSENPMLTYVVLPASVEEFGRDIFKVNYRKDHITLGCFPGSKAIEFARLEGYKMVNASEC